MLGDVPALAVHRSRMVALNAARVAFKHHGNFLDRMTIDRHRASADTFLEYAALQALANPLDHVTMSELVGDSQARRQIEAADQEWLAFDRVIKDYGDRKVWAPGFSLFELRPQPWPHRQRGEDRRIGQMEDWLEAFDRRMKLLSFGVDMMRYAYLEAHAPALLHMLSGEVRLGIAAHAPPITDEVYRRCQRFVIDTALHLGDGDYEADASEARRTALAAGEQPRSPFDDMTISAEV